MNDTLASAIFSGAPLNIKKAVKIEMADRLQEALEDHLEPIINEESHEGNGPEPMYGEQEREAIDTIRQNARFFGADDDLSAYELGEVCIRFRKKQGVAEFTDWLDELDYVEDYDIEAIHDQIVPGFNDTEFGEGEGYDFDKIHNDTPFQFNVYVYLIPEIVTFSMDDELTDEDMEEVAITENVERMDEVRRRIKVNFRGKRRIKMQCRPGFKWDTQARTCKKISGGDLADQRRRLRRAKITKKGMGAGFKMRVLRKTRKAKRFRKSMGLK